MAESIAGSSIRQKSLTTYDIFFNHRGPDTKENFVIPLHEKLHEKGFQSFVDQQAILHGQNLFKTIEEAIRRAHMHLAIFSKTYAQSTYCLKELDQMIVSGKPLVTVFYDVEPEHVRWPRRPGGPYEEAFRKHDKREKPEDVKRWVSTLEGAADIRGFRRAKYRTDDELAEAIVDEVVKIRSPETLIVRPRGGHYDWKAHYKLPAEGRGILFFAAESVGCQLLVAISSEPQVTYPMYEITIRAGIGLNSEIRRNILGDMIHPVCHAPGVVIDPNFGNLKHYWLSIDVETQLIQVGSGKQPDLASLFCIYKDLDFIGKAQYVAFSSWDDPVTYSDISMAVMNPSTNSISLNMRELDIVREPSDLRIVELGPMGGRYNWAQHYQLPKQGQGFVSFAAKGLNDVHVAISPEPRSIDPMYEIVIGGWSNKYSVIRRRSQGPNLFTARVGLIEPQPATNYFWVSVDKKAKLIHVGRGKQLHLPFAFCTFRDLDFIRRAQYICFSSWDTSMTYSDISVASLDVLASGSNDLSTA